MTLKYSDLRLIAIYSTIIPLYKKMGFKADSQISILADNAFYEIDSEIGDKLKSIKAKINELVDEIKKPLAEQFEKDIEGLSEEEIKPIQAKADRDLQIEISKNEDIKKKQKEESELWNKEITSEIKPLEIADKDYAELLSGEKKKVNLFDREFELDGYECLLQLTVKKIITIKSE